MTSHFRTLTSVLVIAASWLLHLACSSQDVRANEIWDCTPRLQTVLHFSIPKLAGPTQDFPVGQIRPTNSIQPDLAADYRLLRQDLHFHIERLTETQQQSCRTIAARLQTQLESFFVRRLNLLADQGNAAGFIREYSALYSPWPLHSEHIELQRMFSVPEAKLLALVHQRLMIRLATTRWAHLAELNPRLEGWSGEWTRFIGREAPGAVMIPAQRVAIQIVRMSLAEIEIFLHHELSHLADSRVRAGQAITEFEAEQYAWTETLDYTSYLRNEGQPRGPLIQRILDAIQVSGLATWVGWNLDSRGSSLP